MKAQPDWHVEGRDWPHAEHSRFVRAAGFEWHVQVMGQGPVLLLVHGTGAASHSWRGVVPLLQQHFTLVIPDLPGHGFSDWSQPRKMSLPAMADQLGDLLRVLQIAPDFAVGHSAGAAILLRMALDRRLALRAVVSLNGALRPFNGFAGLIFPALAKALFLNPFAAPMLAWRATDRVAVARVITGTGSKINEQGLDYYGRLLRSNRHVAATLAMMANWDLNPLIRDLPRLDTRLTLIATERDRAVPLHVACAIKALLPAAELVILPGLGHLAHEENPALLAEAIGKACV